MKRSDPNRRVFLAQTATAATAGAALTSPTHAATEHPEVLQWKREVGSHFLVEGKTLLLHRVTVTDHRADPARPRHLRPHAIRLSFIRDDGRRSRVDRHDLQMTHRSQQIHLSRVVPPQGDEREYYEAVIN